MNEVYSIECTNFPYALDTNRIFFVEREYEWYINQYIGRNRTRFEKAFANFDYEFCYLPCSASLDVAHTVHQILVASRDVNCALCKFGYMDGDKAVFYCVELDNDEHQESLAKQFYHFACWCKVETDRRQRWFELDKLTAKEHRELYGDVYDNVVQSPHVQIVHDVDQYEQLEEYFDAIEESQETKNVSYTDMQLETLHNIAEELRNMGVEESRIREAIEQPKELSRLQITEDHRILLPDYDKEVQLQPIDKALFFLFLRHPNGIGIKQLVDYKDELSAIYSELSGRVNPNVITRSVEAMCNPLKNSTHERLTNIRKAFTSAIGKKLAETYCISGKKGEPKAIILPTELISWS